MQFFGSILQPCGGFTLSWLPLKTLQDRTSARPTAIVDGTVSIIQRTTSVVTHVNDH